MEKNKAALEALDKIADPHNTISHDEFYAAVETIRTALTTQGWQDISTYSGEPAIVTDGDRAAPYYGGFMPWNEGKSIIFSKNKPTHWMPLPAPPSEIVGDEDR